MRVALGSKIADERFMAAFVVGEKRFRWPKELIPLLDDPIDLIRQAARRSLIILSFLELNPDEAATLAVTGRTSEPTPTAKLQKPVDFGPSLGAERLARRTAMERWTAWWDKRGGFSDPSLRSAGADSDPARLANALAKAGPDRRKELVAVYRDAKGVHYTEALAFAVGKIPAVERAALRDALADRMVRMTEATLGRYLEDPVPEIRRAAALGLARKGKAGHAARITDLLLDSDVLVVWGAHSALCQLSGQDFGPEAGACESERAEAAVRWRKWFRAKK